MLRNYQDIKKIYESANSIVYRAIATKNKRSVILKVLQQDYPTPDEVNRYKQEYKITQSFDHDTIVKAYSLERLESSLMMVLEDFGGVALQ